MTARRSLVSLFILLTLANDLRAEDDERVRDEQTLREANLAWDSASLLDYFRRRTPTESQRQRIDSLIEQLGHPAFRLREQATKELTAYGLTAIQQLRHARGSSNPEIASRCNKCLEAIEVVPSGVLTAAVARMTGRIKPDGGLSALLAFLPMVDDDTASDGMRWALARLAVRGGKVEPALLKALNDEFAVRRGATAEAMVRAGLKEHFAEVSKLRRDPDMDVRLRTALILVTVTKDKSAVEDLITMLDTLPIHLGWQAEEVLHQIAGQRAPKETLVGGPNALRNCRAAWEEWWSKNRDAADLTGLTDSARIVGNTMAILRDLNSSEGRVLEYAPDGKSILWQIAGLQMPLDAQIIQEKQRILIAEQDSHLVTERTFDGKVHWQYAIPNPVSCQRFSDGNTFVAARDKLVEITRSGKIVFQFDYAEADIVAARKSPEGHYVFATFHGRVLSIDAKKNVIRSFSTPRNSLSASSMQLLPNNRILIGGQMNAVELDVLSGKTIWKGVVGGMTSSAQRLHNGNTLVSVVKQRSVFELDRDGGVLAEKTISDAIPWRVYRR